MRLLPYLVMFAAAWLLYKMFTSDKKAKVKARRKEEAKLAASGEMVRDPVCGTFISRDSDIRVKSGEKTLCFCSYECRDKYLKELESGK